MVNLITTNSYFDLFPILTKILKEKQTSLSQKNLVFCEEKVSLMAERYICYDLGGSFTTEVYSFGNFLRTRKEFNSVLSKEGSAMAVKKILSTVHLDCFKASKLMLAPTLCDLIMQLKSAKITPEDVLNASNSCGGVLSDKLSDIYAVFNAYENFIKDNGYLDQSSMLFDLEGLFERSREIEGSDVYLVGFAGFTAQMRSAIEVLFDKAKSVTAILCAGDNPLVFVGETADYIKDICKKKNIPLITKHVDGGYNEHGKKIVENLFNPVACKLEKKIDAEVYSYSAPNAMREIERVAQIIKRAVMNGECRYRDVTVALPDPELYKDYVREAFNLLDIPYFLDERKKPENHPLITLIYSYFDVFRKNFERKALAGFYKNPLFNTDKTLCDEFENYVYKYNVNYSKIKEPFTIADKDTERMEQFRQEVVGALSKFDVRAMLMHLGVEEKIEKFNLALDELGQTVEKAVNEQVYAHVIAILDQIENLLGGVNMSVNEFKTVFTTGVNALEISIIPQFLDAVFVGGYKQTALAKAKRLFAVGLTSEVPSVRADVALITDGDIDALNEFKVLIEPKIKVVNHRTRENLALALCAFEEKLYLSYPLTAVDGAKNAKSEVLTQIENMFNCKPFPKEEGYMTARQGEKSFATECGEFIDRQSDFVTASSYYNATDGKDLDFFINNATKGAKVYLDGECTYIGENISPSTIEEYHRCPYRNFLSKALHLKERELGEIQGNSVGNIMHEIFCAYARRLDEVKDESTSKKLFENVANKVLQDKQYSRFLNEPSSSATVKFALSECEKYCYYTYKSISVSNFKVAKTEASFGDNGYYPAIPLLDGAVKIHGKIDRVDVSDKYYRVIDYKTGSADADDASLYSGVKLQLYLYSTAVKNKYADKNLTPAGLYYTKVNDEYVGEEPKAINIGKALLSDDALTAQDKDVLQNKTSMFIPMDKDKHKQYKNIIGEQELKGYMDYAVELSELSVKRMKEGVVVASPCEGACDYCKYKSMCDFDGDNERTVDGVTKQTILGAVQGEENDG